MLNVGKMKSLRCRKLWVNQLGIVLTYSAVRSSKTRSTFTAVPVVSIHTCAAIVTKKAKMFPLPTFRYSTMAARELTKSPAGSQGASHSNPHSESLTNTDAWTPPPENQIS